MPDLSQLAPVVAVVALFLGYMLKDNQRKDKKDEHEEKIADERHKETLGALDRVSVAAMKQAKGSDEVITFMRKLNGTLPRTVKERQAVAEKEGRE